MGDVLSRRALLLATPIAIVAALLAFVVADAVRGDDASTESTIPLDSAPPRVDDLTEIALVDVATGEATDLAAALGGRPTVVNFFGSWCAPCVREMPDLQAAFEDLEGDVAFIGIAVNDQREDAAAIVEETGVTYPSFDDDEGLAFTFFGGITMPTTVFVDETGRVLARKDGALTADDLRAQLRDLYDVEA